MRPFGVEDAELFALFCLRDRFAGCVYGAVPCGVQTVNEFEVANGYFLWKVSPLPRRRQRL